MQSSGGRILFRVGALALAEQHQGCHAHVFHHFHKVHFVGLGLVEVGLNLRDGSEVTQDAIGLLAQLGAALDQANGISMPRLMLVSSKSE